MKKIFKLFLLFCWMALIFTLSSQTGEESSELSGWVLWLFSKIFFVADPNIIILNFSFLIRKLAHFSEYFILGLLMYSVIKDENINHKILFSILFCALYAMSDEAHQLFVANRAGSVLDVLLDSFGSCCSILLFHQLDKYVAKRKSIKARD